MRIDISDIPLLEQLRDIRARGLLRNTFHLFSGKEDNYTQFKGGELNVSFLLFNVIFLCIHYFVAFLPMSTKLISCDMT